LKLISQWDTEILLAMKWNHDDKFEFEHARASFLGGTLSGVIYCRNVIFKPYAFQVDRLELLIKHFDIPKLDVFIGRQMQICKSLLNVL